MKVVHLTSEIYPFVCGETKALRDLGDNVAKLAYHFALKGHETAVFAPLYPSIDREKYNIVPTGQKTWVTMADTVFEFEIFKCTKDLLEFYFFYNSNLFERRGLYGYGGMNFADNDVRFGAFCMASLNFISEFMPDTNILHSHDWQTALVPVYSDYKFINKSYKNVLSIHDISNQGIFSRFSMEKLGLPWSMYTMERLEFYDNINILKGGIVYCNAIVTFNQMQAESFLMHDTGFQLDGVLRKYQDKIVTIPNGIDYANWDPANDKKLKANYSAEEPRKRLLNKEALCNQYDLDYSKPLFCVMSRYVNKEGVDIVLELLPKILGLDINLFLFGKGEEPYIQKIVQEQKNYPNLRVVTENSSEFFRNLLAASDFLFIPYLSTFMGKERRLAMRYGAIPIVRGHGKIKDPNDPIRFYHDSAENVYNVILNALELYSNDFERWEYVKALMKNDSSWDSSAKRYETLYQSLLSGGGQNA